GRSFISKAGFRRENGKTKRARKEPVSILLPIIFVCSAEEAKVALAQVAREAVGVEMILIKLDPPRNQWADLAGRKFRTKIFPSKSANFRVGRCVCARRLFSADILRISGAARGSGRSEPWREHTRAWRRSEAGWLRESP